MPGPSRRRTSRARIRRSSPQHSLPPLPRRRRRPGERRAVGSNGCHRGSHLESGACGVGYRVSAGEAACLPDHARRRSSTRGAARGAVDMCTAGGLPRPSAPPRSAALAVGLVMGRGEDSQAQTSVSRASAADHGGTGARNEVAASDDRSRASRERKGGDARVRRRHPLREPDPRAARRVAGERARAHRTRPSPRRRRGREPRDRRDRRRRTGGEGVHVPCTCHAPSTRSPPAGSTSRTSRTTTGWTTGRTGSATRSRQPGAERRAGDRRRVERGSGLRAAPRHGERPADRDHRRHAGAGRPPDRGLDRRPGEARPRLREGRAAARSCRPRGARVE